MIAAIAKPLGQLLFFLYNVLGNYGIAIIVFTLITKIILFPLTAHQLKTSRRMQELQPKIKELQKKYAKDKETLNVKLMELYKEEKYNPASGCLPLIIQIPIIWGLFALLREPQTYISNPAIIDAVKDSFLWVPNLSMPDPWILPILAGVTTYFSFNLSQTSMPQQQNASMKVMQYFFPVMIVWWGHSFPAGLTLYWFVSTLLQLVQQKLTNVKKTVKEE